jgi:hypothetical protein
MTGPTREVHTGVVDRAAWPSKAHEDFCLVWLEDGSALAGNAEHGEFTPGVPYDFFGKWVECERYGKQFKFQQFIRREPHSRHGVCGYLAKYAPHVGPSIAAQLYDAFGGEAVKVLRTQPMAASQACNRFSVDHATEAAKALSQLVWLEDCKIELTNLFVGRGFPGRLVDEVVERWGILAPARIKRDPFCLLVGEFSGCGFARCDRLYCELGLPKDRIKRQVVCLWHVLNSDMVGHTWFDAEAVVRKLGEHVSGAAVKPSKAIRVGLRAGWLAARKDAAGRKWLAVGAKAKNEGYVAQRVQQLCE